MGESWPTFEQETKKVPTPRTLELLVSDEKSTFDFFCFICGDKLSLALSPQIKQKNQKWIFHRKLKVSMSVIYSCS
jgi:hypothetical protein